MAHTTHWNTHVHIWMRHRTHTHTHTQVSLRSRGIYFLLFPILDCPSSRTPQEQWAACSAREPSEVNCPSLVRDGHVFCYRASHNNMETRIQSGHFKNRWVTVTFNTDFVDIIYMTIDGGGPGTPDNVEPFWGVVGLIKKTLILLLLIVVMLLTTDSACSASRCLVRLQLKVHKNLLNTMLSSRNLLKNCSFSAIYIVQQVSTGRTFSARLLKLWTEGCKKSAVI